MNYSQLGAEQQFSLEDPISKNDIQITPLGKLKVSTAVKLTGSLFEGGIFNSNIWSANSISGGITALNGNILTLSTSSISSNGRIFITYNKIARFLPGFTNEYITAIRISTLPTINNIRRWGIFDSNDGIFFQLSGTQFQCVTRKNAVDSAITSFNNSSFINDLNYHTYFIDYTAVYTYFYQDRNLIHILKNEQTSNTNTYNFKISYENLNINGLSSNIQLDTIGSTIVRYGESVLAPSYVNSISAETKILKYSAGTLHMISINKKGTGGATLSIWDSPSAGGKSIAIIDTTSVLGTLDYHLDFDNGLTFTTSSNNIGDVTIIYD
jgi:hypothetical protein